VQREQGDRTSISYGSVNEAFPSSERVLYVFYDIETTQDTRYTDSAIVHVRNLVCLQQFCVRCESQDNINIDCDRCRKRKHSFWQDPVGDMLSYLCGPRPWVNKVVAIAHNAKSFDLHFVLTRPSSKNGNRGS
jgi:hypothetical protein